MAKSRRAVAGKAQRRRTTWKVIRGAATQPAAVIPGLQPEWVYGDSLQGEFVSLSTRFNPLALQQKYLLARLILLVAAAFILASRVSASMQRGAEADAHEIAETTANHLLFELSLPIVGPLSESD